MILNMFRAARCSSSGGQIVSPQPLILSPSVNSRTVCRLRADSSYQFNAHFLYSITIYMLHYNPQHVSSSTLRSSSGGQVVLLQSVVSSLSVNGRTVRRLRADCSPLSTGVLYGCLQRVTIPETVIIQFVLLKMSARYCSKHVEDYKLTYILL